MNRVRDFEECIMLGVVKVQKPDNSRAEFLVKASGQSYVNLMEKIDKIGIKKSNANDFVRDCYDILMEIIRAKMLLDGYNASGFGAHEAEVSYMRKLNFEEKDIQFADQIRYFRNGILYYGEILDKEYAEKVISFTKQSYIKLKSILQTKS